MPEHVFLSTLSTNLGHRETAPPVLVFVATPATQLLLSTTAVCPGASCLDLTVVIASMSLRTLDVELGNASPNMLSAFDSGDDVGSIDWHRKYLEAKDLLDETRDELEEFRVSSQELEDELERELQRTEKTQQDLRDEVERLKNDREEWKVCYISAKFYKFGIVT